MISFDKQIDSLKSKYEIGNDKEEYELVLSYLRSHDYLLKILEEAYPYLIKYFGESLKTIEYFQDYEEDFNCLTVDIFVKEIPEKALELLYKFDEEYFLNAITTDISFMVIPICEE